MDRMKYHIESNTVQETLVIPLFARKICALYYSDWFDDPAAERICDRLDYDFSRHQAAMTSALGLFGAIEVAQRQYDLLWEVRDYLASHPAAAVVNLGCGLDDSFQKADNGRCRGYNLDFPDVIEIRNALLPAGEREENIACDLTAHDWMDRIDAGQGAVFFASGVFYYMKTEAVKALFQEMARRFPDGVLVFDICNRLGAKMMMKTWLKSAGISAAGAYFSLGKDRALADWSADFAAVSSRSYMRGYRDVFYSVRRLYRILIRFCDYLIKLRILKIRFAPANAKPRPPV